MNKPVLYIFEGNEVEEVITGLKRIKQYIDKEYKKRYAGNTKRSSKEVQGDCTQT